MHLGISESGLLAHHLRLARSLELLIAITGGAGIYMWTARLLRMEEWQPFWAQLASRRGIVETVE